jgi:hypothetical protein
MIGGYSRFGRRLKSLVALACATGFVVACNADSARPVGEVAVRNDSAQSVRVEIDRPNGWPWGLLGPQRDVTWVPTWQAGLCPAAVIGLIAQGPGDDLAQSSVTLSGPAVAQPTTFPGDATRIETGGLTITVNPAETVQVQAAEPTLSPGCAAYPLASGP